MSNLKRVLITGSSRGLGKAMAVYLAKLGYEIVLNYNHNKEAAEETLELIRPLCPKASVLQFDVSNRKEVAEVIEKDIKEKGAYYGVILNAGINADNPFPLLEEEEWDKVLHTDLDGFYNVLKPIVMPMVEERIHGRIITISSISGLIGNRGQVNYSAAKAGIIGASKALAIELAKHKITVNCVAPGIIESDMTKDLPIDEIKRIIPMRRMGKPEEVAALIGFLLSKEASYITRQVISVNGGMI